MNRQESADMMPSPTQLDDLVRAADQQATRLTSQVHAIRMESRRRTPTWGLVDLGTYDPSGPPPVITTAAA